VAKNRRKKVKKLVDTGAEVSYFSDRSGQYKDEMISPSSFSERKAEGGGSLSFLEIGLKEQMQVPM
jgi:hypothetical protein